MKRLRIKVCGMMRPEDAALVAKLGADMVGMIFYRKSPRFINQKRANEIIRAMPTTVGRVGVFVDEEIDRIIQVADKLKLDYVQLHGHESVSQIAELQKHGHRVIKAFAIAKADDYEAVISSTADLCLLDRRTKKQQGGTGKQFDWGIRPRRKLSNLVLAGGISAANVAEGVRLFDPLVVDVNSGVESQPGVKSVRKLRRFFAECDRIRYGA